MKHNIYFILMTVCIIISCATILSQAKQNQDLKRTNISLKDSINELNNLALNLADGISTAYKHAHHEQLRNTTIEDEFQNKIDIRNILNDSTKIIFRFGATNCLSCVKHFCSILHRYGVDKERQIIFIADELVRKRLLFYKEYLNIDNPIYFTNRLIENIDNENRPYVFTLDPMLSMRHLYFPVYRETLISNEYIINILQKIEGEKN